MANFLTRVSAEAPPPLPDWAHRCVQIADLFMKAALSKPASGSLSKTWVTPATILLTTPVGLICLFWIPFWLASGPLKSIQLLVVGIVVVLIAVGTLSVSLVGILQRTTPRK
jgi:hypothetical protein